MATKETTKQVTKKATPRAATEDQKKFRAVWVSSGHPRVALDLGDDKLFVKATTKGVSTVKTQDAATGTGKLRTIKVRETRASGKQLLLVFEPNGPGTRPVQAVYAVNDTGKLTPVTDINAMPSRVAAMLPKPAKKAS